MKSVPDPGLAGQGWSFMGALTNLIHRNLTPDIKRVVEFGGGYSTHLFGLLLATGKISQLVSVEHFPPYFEALKKGLPKIRGLTPVLAELYDTPRLSHGKKALSYATSFKPLISVPDLVFVDGRARVECLLVAALSLSDEGFVVLDDSERARYRGGLRLFETVDSEQRMLVLKPRKELAEIRREFSKTLVFDGPVTLPELENPPGGMGYVPKLPPLTSEEARSLRTILGGLQGEVPSALIWGDCSVDEVLTQLATKPRLKAIRTEHDSHLRSIELATSTLTGDLNDLSRDPNFNYSSEPLFSGEKFFLYVVAGHRRNECLLSVALTAPRDSLTIVRDYSHQRIAPGLSLFDVVETCGNWATLRVRSDFRKRISKGHFGG